MPQRLWRLGALVNLINSLLTTLCPSIEHHVQQVLLDQLMRQEAVKLHWQAPVQAAKWGVMQFCSCGICRACCWADPASNSKTLVLWTVKYAI
jgi:hypothetical protein